MTLRTLILWASGLLLTASMRGQSPTDLLSDSMRQVVKGWAANRTTDRQSLRFCALTNLSLNKELADHRAKDVEQDKEARSLSNQLRLSQAENASKDITIMNQAAIIAPLTTWARVGKWGTVAVGLTTLWVVYKALKP